MPLCTYYQSPPAPSRSKEINEWLAEVNELEGSQRFFVDDRDIPDPTFFNRKRTRRFMGLVSRFKDSPEYQILCPTTEPAVTAWLLGYINGAAVKHGRHLRAAEMTEEPK